MLLIDILKTLNTHISWVNGNFQILKGIISKHLSPATEAKDTVKSQLDADSKPGKSITSPASKPQAKPGITAPKEKVKGTPWLEKTKENMKKRKMELDADVLHSASESDLPSEEESELGLEDQESIGSLSETSLPPGYLSESFSSQTPPLNSSGDIINTSVGRRVYCPRPKTLPKSGRRGASSSTTDPPAPANPDVYEKNARDLVSLFGSLPPVPSDFGTMVTTVTLLRSSTTSSVVCHSATCSTSLKATKCACKSKGHTSPLSLQWCTLPPTDRGNSGCSPKDPIMVSDQCLPKKQASSVGASRTKKRCSQPERSLKH